VLIFGAAALAADTIDSRDCREHFLTSNDSADVRVLFDEARNYMREGRYGTARVAFRTLVAVYPESCLVGPAREFIADLDEREPAQVIRAVRFDGLRRVSPREALERFDALEIGLAADMRFQQESVDEAKGVLRDLLAEKGFSNAQVTATTKSIAPRQVEVTFHVAPAHRRLIGMLR